MSIKAIDPKVLLNHNNCMQELKQRHNNPTKEKTIEISNQSFLKNQQTTQPTTQTKENTTTKVSKFNKFIDYIKCHEFESVMIGATLLVLSITVAPVMLGFTILGTCCLARTIKLIAIGIFFLSALIACSINTYIFNI